MKKAIISISLIITSMLFIVSCNKFYEIGTQSNSRSDDSPTIDRFLSGGLETADDSEAEEVSHATEAQSQKFAENTLEERNESEHSQSEYTSAENESTEEFTEKQSENIAEITTEKATEEATELTTEPSTEATTELTTEPSTEATTELTTEPSTEATTELTTEPSTEATTEKSIDNAEEKATEAFTEKVTEHSTEETNECITEAVIEATTETSAEEASEEYSEEITEAFDEAVSDTSVESNIEETTEETFEANTEITSEESSEEITEASAGSNTDEESSSAGSYVAAVFNNFTDSNYKQEFKHSDGGKMNDNTDTYTFGGYTLKFENYEYIYKNARDATGRSALKIGTSKESAHFEFSVPSDISAVVIKAAKYKDNASRITINGVEYDLTKNSNDGEYDTITIDTSTNKTVVVSTSDSARRCMISSIEYIK